MDIYLETNEQKNNWKSAIYIPTKRPCEYDSIERIFCDIFGVNGSSSWPKKDETDAERSNPMIIILLCKLTDDSEVCITDCSEKEARKRYYDNSLEVLSHTKW